MLNIRPLSKELAQKAKEELFEDPDRIAEDLAAINEWLDKQPHIIARRDEQWIVNFLRGCKYSLERTKEKMDLFYTMRTIAPEITLPVDTRMPIIEKIIKLGSVFKLKDPATPDGPRITIVRLGLIESTKMPVIDFIRGGLTSDYLGIFNDDQSVVAGEIFIVDVADVSSSFFTQITPSLAKKIVLTRQNAMPLRPKQVHVINTPVTYEKIANFLKSFLNEKIRKRIYIYSGTEELYKVVPKAILPKEYGGDGESTQEIIDRMSAEFEAHREWFLEDAKYKTDESKRPGKPKTSEMLFGIEGSFRKLDVD